MALQPIKASLIQDLVDLVNENLGALVTVELAACTHCPDPADEHADVCSVCGGVGVTERYTLDMPKLQEARYGRLIEGFDVKQGQLVPKFRSKDKAFAMLVKLLGFDKAVVEIANASFAESVPVEERDRIVEHFKTLLRDGVLE